MSKIKENSLAHSILMYLKDTSKNLLVASAMIVFEPGKVMRRGGVSMYKDYNKDYIYRRSYNIKRSPYFTVKNDIYYVSNKGRIEIIKFIIEDKKKAKKWDGKWRVVIFDVPESKRHHRNFLRKELKLVGFKELQHSVWITPYDIEKELLCLLKFWQNDFSGDIRFLVVEKMSHDQDFKELFLPRK